MPGHDRNADLEWRAHWPLVLAAMAGLSLSVVPINSIGLFMGPLQAEFGWTRSRVASGLTVFAIVAVPLSPLLGGLIDRWGVRRLALPGLALTSAAFAAFGLANGSPVQWWGLWLGYSLVALGIKATIWTSAVSSVFKAGRGLALAMTLCGSAIGATVAPLLARWLIDDYGWRIAFAAMGAGWGGAALLLAIGFLFDARDNERRQPRTPTTKAAPAGGLTGLNFKEALRNVAFLRIAGAVLLINLLMVAIIVHLVPMLTQNGLSGRSAARVASALGIAAVAGKLISGWVLDHTDTNAVGSLCMALPAISCMMLMTGSSDLNLAFLAVIVCGVATGAQVQVTTYLTTRYVGLRNYGKLYGILISCIALATGTGPLLAAMLYDRFGTYRLLLIFGIVICAICAGLMTRLGPYPRFADDLDCSPHAPD